MATKTPQDYFWALTVAGIVYLGLQLMAIGGFISLMISGSAFSWALKGGEGKQDEETESMIRPPRKFRDLKRLQQGNSKDTVK